MDLPLSEVKGIGPARLKALADAGITSVRELVMDLPREYRDLRESTPLCEAKAGESAAYRVQVAGDATEQRARRLLITRVYVTDGTETLMAVWYNQPWLKKQLPRGRELLLYGKAEIRRGALQLVSPTIETGEEILPVYKPIPGVPQKVDRKSVV